MAIGSSKLSPQARILLSTAKAGDVATVTLEIGRDDAIERVRAAVARTGGHVDAYTARSRHATVTLPVRQLEEIARIRGVTYLDVGGKFANPEAGMEPDGPPGRKQ